MLVCKNIILLYLAHLKMDNIYLFRNLVPIFVIKRKIEKHEN
jgi:hypothetical protein